MLLHKFGDNKSKVSVVMMFLLYFVSQKKLFMDEFDLPHVTCSWSSLTGQKKTILATRKIPYSFCGKVINTLVDGLRIPRELNGKENRKSYHRSPMQTKKSEP